MEFLVENIVVSDLSESEICIPLHLQTWEFPRLILEDFEWLQLTEKNLRLNQYLMEVKIWVLSLRVRLGLGCSPPCGPAWCQVSTVTQQQPNISI